MPINLAPLNFPPITISVNLTPAEASFIETMIDRLPVSPSAAAMLEADAPNLLAHIRAMSDRELAETLIHSEGVPLVSLQRTNATAVVIVMAGELARRTLARPTS